MAQAAPVKVVVHGASGRMGREVLRALCQEPDMEPVGAVFRRAAEDFLSLPDNSGLIPLARSLEPLIPRCRPQVVVDFTSAEGLLAAARVALPQGVRLVSGSSGLSAGDREELQKLCERHRVGAVLAPNFALGAVLLQHLARTAAPFFEVADIVEAHHEGKADSPSGTAIAIAQAMVEAHGREFKRPTPTKEPVKGARGAEVGGVSLHSLRAPGRMAHHEVIFGLQGQTLTLRHDTIDRQCYMPGVLLAVRRVLEYSTLVVGLEQLLGLPGRA